MTNSKMPVVILAGGLGTRLREETEYKPKPMVEIGSHPILWHIMKTYSNFGFNEFIICAGYKKEIIQDYFLNFNARNSPFTINLDSPGKVSYLKNTNALPWKVTVVDTGENTNTGGRIWQIQEYINGRSFFCTYGDGLANINISELLKFHKQHGKISTLTAVKPQSRFGILDISANNQITSFVEKPAGDTWINGGFFVFEPSIFSYLKDDIVLENEPLEKLSSSSNLMAYKHLDFWQPMDTFREFKMLNDLWESGRAPWKIWE